MVEKGRSKFDRCVYLKPTVLMIESYGPKYHRVQPSHTLSPRHPTYTTKYSHSVIPTSDERSEKEGRDPFLTILIKASDPDPPPEFTSMS